MFGIPVYVLVVAGLIVATTVLIMSLLVRLYRKAGPHQALVVYGFRGTRVVQGGGTVVFPLLEECRDLSLELMSFDVARSRTFTRGRGLQLRSSLLRRSR